MVDVAMPVTTAVIPAAGFGTRMLPAAKAVPKELLPILDRPTIQYVIEETAASGIEDVVLVTSQGKEAIAAHFRENPRLSERLKTSAKTSLLAQLDELISKMTFHYVDQPEQLGLGDAVYRARQRVADRPFLCLLGDTIFSGDPLPSQQLMQAHQELGTALIGLEQVPAEKVGRYGIVGGTMIRPGLMRIDALVEKPAPAEAPSRLAIAARYVLTPAIFPCLEQTSPGKGGEIQLTDALKHLLKREPIHGIILNARRHDIGNPIDWLKTNLLLARKDQKLWREIAPLLDELKGEDGASV
jgi:UTP--glucose-1-phosphate uridylyltransferase